MCWGMQSSEIIDLIYLLSKINKKWQLPVNDGPTNQDDNHYDTKTNGDDLRHRCKEDILTY